ncbi:MAG: glycosyltransferase family 2 protein [Myxococcales bacterium]|nr:glycosyltransferase family 2 protein [Myxococcales bacterium]
MRTPLVTIAMPAFNEEHYIEACIRSVQAQDYPGDRIEILIADGRSTDRTREILAELAIDDPRIKVIDNPDRLQAAGLNQLIRAARGEIVVRMDVHCEYTPSYVRTCVEQLEATGADNVGGAQRAKAKTAFQRALCAALASPVGVGGARYRDATAEGFVDTVFLGAFRKRIFERIGLYDPKAITNEDAELNQRLLASGGKIYLSPAIEVHYYPRDSFATLAKQYWKYGRGRARTLLKLGRFPTLRPLIPFGMVLGASALIVLPPLWPIAPAAFAAYALLTGAEAVRVAAPLGPVAVATAWAIFPVLHASHGAGFASGLLRYLRDPDWGPVETLDARPALRAV